MPNIEVKAESADELRRLLATEEIATLRAQLLLARAALTMFVPHPTGNVEADAMTAITQVRQPSLPTASTLLPSPPPTVPPSVYGAAPLPTLIDLPATPVPTDLSDLSDTPKEPHPISTLLLLLLCCGLGVGSALAIKGQNPLDLISPPTPEVSPPPPPAPLEQPAPGQPVPQQGVG